MLDEFDEWTDGDYPTPEALARIETWSYHDLAGALDFVKDIWHWPDFASHDLRPEEAAVVHAEPGERYLRLATGGWSGNESIIAAMRANTMLHAMTWRLRSIGGLHIYRYPADRSEPHIVGTEQPTAENDPVGRFRPTS